MCCETTGTLGLPPAVIEMLARYRRLLQDRGWDCGDDRIDLFRWARFSLLGPVFDAFAATGDARWCLAFLDTLERFVGEHGHFDPATRTAHLGALVTVLDQARSFYRKVAESAER